MMRERSERGRAQKSLTPGVAGVGGGEGVNEQTVLMMGKSSNRITIKGWWEQGCR